MKGIFSCKNVEAYLDFINGGRVSSLRDKGEMKKKGKELKNRETKMEERNEENI